MQGCGREKTTVSTEATNNVAEFQPTNQPQMIDTGAIAAVAPSNATPDLTAPPPPAPTDYTIVTGDSFSKLATRFHVSVSALMAANPGVEPTRLQPGKKIKIPPPAPVATTTTPPPAPTNGDTIYSVKSGDSLSKIASDFHTSVKALRAANNLKTDSIRVGQKLTIPKSDVALTNGTSVPK